MEDTDQAAVVTGAGGGIGRAIALALAGQGIRVVASDKNAEAVDATVRLAAERGAAMVTHNGDVTDDLAMEALAECSVSSFGRLDFAINCAGGGDRAGPFAKLDEHDFDVMIALNLKGIFLAMRHQLRHMAAAGHGSIVNIASTAGLRGIRGGALYAAAKHGVLGLTKCAALDYAANGIRVNAICPGAIATQQFERVIGQRFPDRPLEEAVAAVGAGYPLGRVGTPDEVAGLALWLISDAARYITGQAFAVDGGKTIE